MKNQILPLGEETFKVMGFSDEQIIFSSKRHDTFEALLASSQKPGLLESLKTIPVNAIQEISYNEKDGSFTIKYSIYGKNKKDTVVLSDKGLRESVVAEIATFRKLNKAVSEESKTRPLILNLLGGALIIVFTIGFRWMAINAQHGEHYVATGRKRGIGQLLANTVEAIGPTWITIIGVLGLALMVYITYKRYNNPASEIKYS